MSKHISWDQRLARMTTDELADALSATAESDQVSFAEYLTQIDDDRAEALSILQEDWELFVTASEEIEAKYFIETCKKSADRLIMDWLAPLISEIRETFELIVMQPRASFSTDTLPSIRFLASMKVFKDETSLYRLMLESDRPLWWFVFAVSSDGHTFVPKEFLTGDGKFISASWAPEDLAVSLMNLGPVQSGVVYGFASNTDFLESSLESLREVTETVRNMMKTALERSGTGYFFVELPFGTGGSNE